METSRGEDSIEFRKWKLEQAQEWEFRLKQMELQQLEIKARSEERQLEIKAKS